MPLRLLHTADWHLGLLLHEFDREFEHAEFLRWLLDTIERERVDALIHAGDVFDSANPPASAQKMWYGFLAELHRRRPGLTAVVVGGNHDSASRLEAPQVLLREIGATVVGALPRTPAGGIDLERLLVPLRDAAGVPAAWVAAVPYLRPADLPAEDGDPTSQVEGMRRVYSECLAAARLRAGSGAAVIATGHLTAAGGTLTEASERRIQGGNRWPLPADAFPDEVAYVALGHLHLRQEVAGRRNVRYSGSPIPLSLAEAGYAHEVVIVDLDGPRCVGVRGIPVPRAVAMLRLPEDGPGRPDEVLARLRSLPGAPADAPSCRHAFLEARVRVERPEPGLPARAAEALKGKAARLVKLTVEYGGAGTPLADAAPATTLADLTPEEVFRKKHRQKYDREPSADLLAAYLELLEEVRRGEGAA